MRELTDRQVLFDRRLFQLGFKINRLVFERRRGVFAADNATFCEHCSVFNFIADKQLSYVTEE